MPWDDEAGLPGSSDRSVLGLRQSDLHRRAVALGASGYVLKSAPREELIDALQTAVAGESAWTREELRRVTGALATPRLAKTSKFR